MEENKYECEIIEKIYNKKNKSIYKSRKNECIKSKEKDVERCKNTLLCFLKEHLTEGYYDTAFNYINALIGKNDNLMKEWNKVFYISGINDGVDY